MHRVNFNPLEILERIQKVHILNKIQHDPEMEGFEFPMKSRVRNDFVEYDSRLPSYFEIEAVIKDAYAAAKSSAEGLAMTVSEVTMNTTNLYASPATSEIDEIENMDATIDYLNGSGPYFEIQNLKFINEESGNKLIIFHLIY